MQTIVRMTQTLNKDGEHLIKGEAIEKRTYSYEKML